MTKVCRCNGQQKAMYARNGTANRCKIALITDDNVIVVEVSSSLHFSILIALGDRLIVSELTRLDRACEKVAMFLLQRRWSFRCSWMFKCFPMSRIVFAFLLSFLLFLPFVRHFFHFLSQFDFFFHITSHICLSVWHFLLMFVLCTQDFRKNLFSC